LIYKIQKNKKTKQKKDWGRGARGSLPSSSSFSLSNIDQKRIANTKGAEEEGHGNIDKDKLPSSFCF
jgi:hypothetical protein